MGGWGRMKGRRREMPLLAPLAVLLHLPAMRPGAVSQALPVAQQGQRVRARAEGTAQHVCGCWQKVRHRSQDAEGHFDAPPCHVGWQARSCNVG